MTKTIQLVADTAAFVKKTLQDAEGGHDWFHIERVWHNALLLMKSELNVDRTVVELGALLHDIADAKFYDGNEEIGPKVAREYLESQNVEEDIIKHVENIVRHISFKRSIHGQVWTSPELQIVQDADRLDALGAIGIARTFNYGGHKGRALYNPDIAPNHNMTKEEYKNSTAPTLNHFYEKLFLLKDKMNTDTGKRIAQDRHDYMINFVDQFLFEWRGEK